MRTSLSLAIALSLLISLSSPSAQAGFIPSETQVKVMFQMGKTGFLGIAQSAAGKEMFRIAAAPTSKEVLRTFGPRALGETFKKAAVGTGSLMLRKMKRFPVESLGFFVALGAVMTYNLTFNPNHNPVGYQQLIDSQMDPLGQFAFYSFMVANGMVAEPMMSMIHKGKLHPGLRHFIPYLGMSVGMTASHIVHELGNAEDLKKCVAEFMTLRDATESCEAAHEAWIERGGMGGLTHELAPSLIGLIGSTILAGGAQKLGVTLAKVTGASAVVKVAGKIALGSVLKLIGVEVATFVIPGGIVVKFIRGAFGFVAQMALFTWVQEQIQPGITFAYKNLTDGKILDNQVADLSNAIKQERAYAWQSPAIGRPSLKGSKFELVLTRLDTLGKSFSAWRETNMEQVLIVQSNWEQATGQLAQQYRITRNFYSDLLENQWQKENGKLKDNYRDGIETHILDRPLLEGVPTIADTEKDAMMYSQSPELIEQGQVQYIHHILGNYEIGVHKPERLNQQNQAYWDATLKTLKSTDLNVINTELDRIRCLCAIPRTFPRKDLNGQCNYSISIALNDSYRALLKKITASNIMAKTFWGSGNTYLQAYQIENDLSTVRFDQPLQNMKLEKSVDKLLASAVMGPIPGREKLIHEDAGYPVRFSPPRLTVYPLKLVDPISGKPVHQFMQMQVSNTKNCTMAFDCLLENLNPNIYSNRDYAAFDKWWESNVEPEYLKAWVKFEQKYQYNIGLLINALWQPRSFWNGGNLANGIMQSYLEEARIYLAIINAIARDEIIREKGQVPPFMMREAKKVTSIGNVQFGGLQFHWESKFLEQLESMTALLKNIETRTIPDYTGKKEDLPVSRLTTEMIEERAKELNHGIVRILDFMTKNVKMSPYQQAVVSVALQNLANIPEEIKNLGLIVNAASYLERHDGSAGYIRPSCDAIKKTRGMSMNPSVQAIVQECQK